MQHQFRELDAVAQRAGGGGQVQLGRDLDAEAPRGADRALQAGGFGDRRDFLDWYRPPALAILMLITSAACARAIYTTSCGV